jgi:hypothetical protein
LRQCAVATVFAFRTFCSLGVDGLGLVRPHLDAKHQSPVVLLLLLCDWFTRRTRQQQQREASEKPLPSLHLQVPERVHDAHIMLPDTARCNAIHRDRSPMRIVAVGSRRAGVSQGSFQTLNRIQKCSCAL